MVGPGSRGASGASARRPGETAPGVGHVWSRAGAPAYNPPNLALPAAPEDHSMKSKDLLVALFALGFVLLSWPLLTVVNRPVTVLGIPSLVLYLFLVWAGIIAVLFWLTGGRDSG